MIQPTPGRMVWYRPNGSDTGVAHYSGDAPLAATVTHVWSDRCVNLTVFDSAGTPHARTSVPLVQDGDTAPGFAYCEWMPYQKGQAAKTEALETGAAARAAGTTSY